MGLFTTAEEKKTQLFFRDDNTFEFKKRLLQDSCFVEKDGDSLKRGWKHFYGCEIPFPGYKKIPSDMVTLGFSRDIILDPFDKVPKGEELNNKPNVKIKDSLKNWIAKIAENQRHKYQAKRETNLMVDRINWLLIAIASVMLLGWGIRYATG